jgi:hypothetical protein
MGAGLEDRSSRPGTVRAGWPKRTERRNASTQRSPPRWEVPQRARADETVLPTTAGAPATRLPVRTLGLH